MSALPPFCDELRFDRGCACAKCLIREAAVIAANASNLPTPILPPPMTIPTPPGPWPSFGGWVLPPTMPAPVFDTSSPPSTSAPVVPNKLPPMNCIKCQFRNEYVGIEHLDKDGRYICRSCKKR